MATEPNVLEVRILNSENNTAYYLYVREERLKAFHELLSQRPYRDVPAGMPGLGWQGMLGLDAIFEKRPRRFPVHDILGYLANGTGASPTEVEKTLEKFSTQFPPDVAETA